MGNLPLACDRGWQGCLLPASACGLHPRLCQVYTWREGNYTVTVSTGNGCTVLFWFQIHFYVSLHVLQHPTYSQFCIFKKKSLFLLLESMALSTKEINSVDLL